MRKGEEETNASRRERPGNGRPGEVSMTNDVRIAMNDIDRTMERLRTGAITAQYGSLRSRPTKDEAGMNYMPCVSNHLQADEGRKSHEKRKRKKNNAQKGARRGQTGRRKKFS